MATQDGTYDRTALGVDARNPAQDIANVPGLMLELKGLGVQCEIVCLVANDDELLKRFSETKRRHPLSGDFGDLPAAIARERKLLEPILYAADLVIDTSRMGVHELRDTILKRVEQRASGRLSISFESFGFKNGLPGDADFVFDARLGHVEGAIPHLHAHAEVGTVPLTESGERGNSRQIVAHPIECERALAAHQVLVQD